MSWTMYIELLSCVVYFSLDDRKQKPKFLTELAVGRQKVNNPVDHVSPGIVLSFSIQHNFCPHPDFNLHPTLISKTESLMWEERRLERLKKRGSNGQIIEEYDFKSCAILFWSWETYSSLEIKRCGLFCVFRHQWIKELRFPTAAYFVSSEDLKQWSCSLSTSLSAFLPTVPPDLAIYLLSQSVRTLLGVVKDIQIWLTSPQMVSLALTVKMSDTLLNWSAM